jgi:MoaA/NifB/PqqE/SkfB family radical SAM enzyme
MNRVSRLAKILISSPSNIPALISHRIMARLSYRFTPLLNAWSYSPEGINIYPTDRCNLRCAMCFERLKTPEPELTIKEWQGIIKSISRFRPRIHLSGGEPFVYRDIGALIYEIKRNQLYLTITTNGTLLERHAQDIVRLGVNRIHVSIDGPRQVHDDIRGVPGTFDRLIKGLELLQQYKKKTTLPVIRINSMISERTSTAMKEVIKIAHHIGAESIQFLHPLFVDSKALSQHRAFLQRNLKNDLNHWQGADIPCAPPADYEAFHRHLQAVSLDPKVRVEVFPQFTPEQMRAYYENRPDFYAVYKGTCRAMWNTATILPSGNVESCPDYVIGNCRTQDFLLLWNDGIMKALRKRIHQKNFFQVCRACCHYYFK